MALLLCFLCFGPPLKRSAHNIIVLFNPLSRADLVSIIKQHHPNHKLIMAIIEVESEWKQNVISHAGAIGLMQVLPSSARMVGLNYTKEDLKDPEKNIKAGCRIVKFYQRKSNRMETVLNWYSGGAENYHRKVMKKMKG